MPVSRLLLGYGVLALAFLLFVGCSGDPEPVVASTPSAPTSSSQPSPSESSSPEPREEPESAEDFIRRWFEEHNIVSSTGNSQQFRRMSKGCMECLAVAESYKRIYRAGGSVEGGVITVTSLKRLGKAGASETWIARLTATPTRYRERADSPIRTLDGGRAAYRFVLRTSTPIRISELYQESL